MTLAQLEYALAVDRFLSFSRAAEACHVTQPSLSAQIQKLEKELDVLIFDRSKNPVAVTDAGREILDQGRRVIEEMRRLEEVAASRKKSVQGVFRLGIIPTIAPSLLPHFLNQFSKKFPEVKLVLSEDKTSNLIKELDRGELDGAILATPEKAPEGLLERSLYYEPFVIYAGKNSPLLAKKKLLASELSADDAILLDETHCMRDQVEQICRSRKASARKALEFEGGSLQTLISIVESGDQYTFLPLLSAMTLPSRVRDQHVRTIDKPVPMRKVSLVYHRAYLKRAILDALVQIISNHLPDEVSKNPGANAKVLAPDPEKFSIES